MRTTLISILLLSGSLPVQLAAQSDSTIRAGFYRDFTMIYAANCDVLNASENVRASLKIMSDLYQIDLKPRIKSAFLRGATEVTWNTLLKWSTLLWPHEYGHALRTQQHGGRFFFQQFRFPGIVSVLELPENAPTEHHLLALIGGFEANALSARNVQLDFYRYGGLYNDEFGMAFGHRILYPLYAYAFDAQNPEDPQTWVRQEGDPVNFAHLTWQMGGRAVFNADGSVNPDLVRFYRQAGLLSVLWNLLDWNFYRQASAFFGNQLAGKRPTYIGNEKSAWFYSTLFNTSVLGAELYLWNYFRHHNRLYMLYVKGGFPYRNLGLGLTLPDVINFRRLSIDVHADLWQQDFYGTGISAHVNLYGRLFRNFDLVVQSGYKTEGYVLGRPVREGFIGFLGLRHRLRYIR